jgi:hypothetical protein
VNVAQKWVAGLIALGAIYLVLAPNSHIVQALGAGQKFISGTEHTALTGNA